MVMRASGNPDAVESVMYPVYFWAGVIAVVVIVVAGFYYVTSNGNPQQVTRAKNAILGAVVGLIVVLLAFAITAIILGGL
jgi:Ni,Fe-hydrogenase I cytochrome b subunit